MARYPFTHLAGLLALLIGHTAQGAEFCASSTDALQLALDSAAASPEADRIMLESGTITAPTTGFSYLATDYEAGDLTIIGGFDIGCISRPSGSKTILDGSTSLSATAMTLVAPAASVLIQHIRFHSHPHRGSFFNHALSVTVDDGMVRIEANEFRFNSGTQGTAIFADSERGSIYVIDNVFADNLGSNDNSTVQMGSFAPMFGEALECVARNNTFLNNTAGLRLAHCETAVVDNNVIRGSTSWNLWLANYWERTIGIEWNAVPDLSVIWGPPLRLTVQGNVFADPGIGAADGWLPSAASPVINAGNPSLQLDNPTDFYDNPRIDGGRVDIGAVEFQVTLMRDGFE